MEGVSGCLSGFVDVYAWYNLFFFIIIIIRRDVNTERNAYSIPSCYRMIVLSVLAKKRKKRAKLNP